jgi:hypothetical protein
MRYVNQAITGIDVNLDFNEFVDCVIKDCVVTCNGGPFSLLRTKFERVRFSIGGPAMATLSFLKLVKAHGPNLLDELMSQGDQPTPAEPAKPAATN